MHENGKKQQGFDSCCKNTPRLNGAFNRALFGAHLQYFASILERRVGIRKSLLDNFEGIIFLWFAITTSKSEILMHLLDQIEEGTGFWN